MYSSYLSTRPASFPRRLAAGIVVVLFLVTNVLFPYAAEAGFWDERRHAAQRMGSRAADADRGSVGASLSSSLTPDEERLFAQLPRAGEMPMGAAPLADAAGGLSLGGTDRGLAPAASTAIPGSGENGALTRLTSQILPFGSLRSMHVSSRADAPLIVHIQDAHGIEEAQRNIAGIIDAVSRENDGKRLLVGVEGAEGAFPLIEPLKAIARPSITKDVADAFLKEGTIGGAEYAALTSSESPVLWGVEHMPDHRANVQSVRDSVKKRPEADAWIKDLSSRSEALKKDLYSPELKEFDRRTADYHDYKEPLGDYARYLMGGDAKGFPNLRLLVKALDAENELDFKKVERERIQLVERLARALPRRALDDLVSRSLQHRMGQLSYGQYHSYLKILCRAHGVSFGDLPQLSAYVDYVLLAEKMDREKLLDELTAREKAVERILAATPGQKRLAAASRRIGLVEKLLDHKMTPADWADYEKNRDEILVLPGELAALAGDVPSPLTGEGQGEGEIANFLHPFEDFCGIALKRNKAMTENLLAGLRQSAADGTTGEAAAVLIAGGFHSDDLVDRLTKEGASVIVVTPKITEVPKDSHYLDVFSRDPLPLEKMFSGQIISLKKALALSVPNPDSTRLAAMYAAVQGASEGVNVSDLEKRLRAALPQKDIEVTIDTAGGVTTVILEFASGAQVRTFAAASEALASAAKRAGVRLVKAEQIPAGDKIVVLAQVVPLPAQLKGVVNQALIYTGSIRKAAEPLAAAAGPVIERELDGFVRDPAEDLVPEALLHAAARAAAAEEWLAREEERKRVAGQVPLALRAPDDLLRRTEDLASKVLQAAGSTRRPYQLGTGGTGTARTWPKTLLGLGEPFVPSPKTIAEAAMKSMKPKDIIALHAYLTKLGGDYATLSADSHVPSDDAEAIRSWWGKKQTQNLLVTLPPAERDVQDFIGEDGEIVKKLGEGGMGVVYLVKRQGREVVVKTTNYREKPMPLIVLIEMEWINRSEADKLRILKGTSLTPDFNSQEGPFMIEMDFVHGEALREIRDVQQAVDVLSVVAVMNKYGLAHHDIKAENLKSVTVLGEWMIFVLDTGATIYLKDGDASGRVNVQPGHFMLSLKYCAPELEEHLDQMSKTGRLPDGYVEKVGEKTDAYAAAVLLRNLLPLAVLRRPSVWAVLRHGLDPNPRERWTAQQMRDELSKLLEGEQVEEPPLEIEPEMVPPQAGKSVNLDTLDRFFRYSGKVGDLKVSIPALLGVLKHSVYVFGSGYRQAGKKPGADDIARFVGTTIEKFRGAAGQAGLKGKLLEDTLAVLRDYLAEDVEQAATSSPLSAADERETVVTAPETPGVAAGTTGKVISPQDVEERIRSLPGNDLIRGWVIEQWGFLLEDYRNRDDSEWLALMNDYEAWEAQFRWLNPSKDLMDGIMEVLRTERLAAKEKREAARGPQGELTASVVELAGGTDPKLLAKACSQLQGSEKRVLDPDVVPLAANSLANLSEALALRLYWDIKNQGISPTALNIILTGASDSPGVAGDVAKLSATAAWVAIRSQPGLPAALFLRRALDRMSGAPTGRLTTEATKIAGRAAALKPWGLFRAIVRMHRGGSALVAGPLTPGSKEEARLDRLIEVWYSQSYEAWRLTWLAVLAIGFPFLFWINGYPFRSQMNKWLADHGALSPTGEWQTEAAAEKAQLTRTGTRRVLFYTGLGLLLGTFLASYFLMPWLGGGDLHGVAAAFRGIALALGILAAGALSGNLAGRLPHMIWNIRHPTATLTASEKGPRSALGAEDLRKSLGRDIPTLFTARENYRAFMRDHRDRPRPYLIDIDKREDLLRALDRVQAAYRESGVPPGLSAMGQWMESLEFDPATAAGHALFLNQVFNDDEFSRFVRGEATAPSQEDLERELAIYMRDLVVDQVSPESFVINRTWPEGSWNDQARHLTFSEVIPEARHLLNGPSLTAMRVGEAGDSVVRAALQRAGFISAGLDMVHDVKALIASQEPDMKVSELTGDDVRAAMQRAAAGNPGERERAAVELRQRAAEKQARLAEEEAKAREDRLRKAGEQRPEKPTAETSPLLPGDVTILDRRVAEAEFAGVDEAPVYVLVGEAFFMLRKGGDSTDKEKKLTLERLDFRGGDVRMGPNTEYHVGTTQAGENRIYAYGQDVLPDQLSIVPFGYNVALRNLGRNIGAVAMQVSDKQVDHEQIRNRLAQIRDLARNPPREAKPLREGEVDKLSGDRSIRTFTFDGEVNFGVANIYGQLLESSRSTSNNPIFTLIVGGRPRHLRPFEDIVIAGVVKISQRGRQVTFQDLGSESGTTLVRGDRDYALSKKGFGAPQPAAPLPDDKEKVLTRPGSGLKFIYTKPFIVNSGGTSFLLRLESGLMGLRKGLSVKVILPSSASANPPEVLEFALSASEESFGNDNKMATIFIDDPKISKAQWSVVRKGNEITVKHLGLATIPTHVTQPSDPNIEESFGRSAPLATTFKTKVKGLAVWFTVAFVALAWLAGIEWPTALATAGAGTLALFPILNALTSLSGLAHLFERGAMGRDARALAEEHRQPLRTEELVVLFGYFLHRERVGREFSRRWRLPPSLTAFVFGAAAHSMSNLRHMLGRPSPFALPPEDEAALASLDPRARVLARVLMSGSARPVNFDPRPGVVGDAARYLSEGRVRDAMESAFKSPDEVTDPFLFRAALMGALAGESVTVSENGVLYVYATGFENMRADRPEWSLLSGMLSKAAADPRVQVVIAGTLEGRAAVMKLPAAQKIPSKRMLIGAAKIEAGRVNPNTVETDNRSISVTGSIQAVAIEEDVFSESVKDAISLKSLVQEISNQLRTIAVALASA